LKLDFVNPPEDRPENYKQVADLLFAYLHDIIYKPTAATLDIETLPESFRDFGKGLLYFNHILSETRTFAKELAIGNLDATPPPPSNEIVSALKSLHASLKHLTWQTQQVAKGDYNQNVKFMGDFSVAFNNMINQLEERRKLIAEERAKLEDQLHVSARLSLLDPLTGIPNRRAFDERLHMEWNQAIRENTSISLLVIDIDKFKLLNDTYGHQQGDIVLQTIAPAFTRSSRRAGDFSARWGGEEFIILLPNTPLAGAMDVAETIRLSIESMSIPCTNGSSINITISIGVNTTVPTKTCQVDKFIFNADRALYAAKEAGRNKVVHLSSIK